MLEPNCFLWCAALYLSKNETQHLMKFIITQWLDTDILLACVKIHNLKDIIMIL